MIEIPEILINYEPYFVLFSHTFGAITWTLKPVLLFVSIDLTNAFTSEATKQSIVLFRKWKFNTVSNIFKLVLILKSIVILLSLSHFI